MWTDPLRYFFLLTSTIPLFLFHLYGYCIPNTFISNIAKLPIFLLNYLLMFLSFCVNVNILCRTALKKQVTLLFTSLEQHGDPTHVVNTTVVQYLYYTVRPLFKDYVKFR